MWRKDREICRKATQLFGMVERGQLSGDGSKMAGLLNGPGKQFRGNGDDMDSLLIDYTGT